MQLNVKTTAANSSILGVDLFFSKKKFVWIAYTSLEHRFYISQYKYVYVAAKLNLLCIA